MGVQIVEVIEPTARDSRLDELLRKYHASRKNRVLVFVLYKKEAARVEAMLRKKGWKVSLLGVYTIAHPGKKSCAHGGDTQ